jgi:putative nucleotidyltransferase with HDIG domain
VQALPLENLRRIASRVPVFDFFDNSREAGEDAERFRLHALATQRAAERVRQEVGAGSRDDIAIAALLHDVGKIVLLAAYDRYREIAFVRGTPEQRLLLERRELGIDHVMAGGVLARRLGLPDQLVAAITGHHADERGPDAAVVRVADMLVHHQSGQPIDRPALKRAARTLGLSDEALNSLHYDLTQPPAGGPRESDPSPLSERQHAVLKLLAEGKLYKQIALELGLSTSTVRSHLNNTYAKLDVTDRAQAVLRAAERGWL